jgi:hypothetical protein
MNHTLTVLSLNDISISTVDLSSIIISLQQNKSLTDLNLCHNDLHDDIAIVVGEMLKCNTTLINLNMWSS